MLNYTYQALESFKLVFSRNSTWLIFCAIVLCFMTCTQMIGVTSFCRFWLVTEAGYHSFCHFFRSKAYTYSALLDAWIRFVLKQDVAVKVSERSVLLGDHTHVVKDGRRMPGVVSLRENSETQTKPSYFRAHSWGAIGLVIGSMSACFCLPLQLQIHLGFRHLGFDEQYQKDNLPNMAERLVQMAVDFASRYDRHSILVLDAFFPTKSVFRIARSVYSDSLKQPYVEILVRAKKNYVAYFAAEPKPKNRPGPQKKYGDKVSLIACFDQPHLFHTITCNVYGKTESIQMMTATLLWKPIEDWLLFIFAITSRGPIILMSSDLNLSPTQGLTLYCTRTRIEIMFDTLKNIIGAFNYRFWTKKMPLHSRSPVSNKYLKQPSAEELPAIQACWQAYEVFVLCGAIAQGLLQLISLKFSELIWENHVLYLRTKSRYLPSEKTVSQIINQILLKELFDLYKKGIIQKIRGYFLKQSHEKEPRYA
jgi:hypothetical protein